MLCWNTHSSINAVFAAFVYDEWWDSKSSINLGGKAPDTTKIAEFYWSSPLSGSFAVLSSWLDSIHVHLSRGKRFLWGWTKDPFFCTCWVNTSSTCSGCSVDNVPKISSEKFAHIRKTYVSQDEKYKDFMWHLCLICQWFCLLVPSDTWNKYYFLTPSYFISVLAPKQAVCFLFFLEFSFSCWYDSLTHLVF